MLPLQLRCHEPCGASLLSYYGGGDFGVKGSSVVSQVGLRNDCINSNQHMHYTRHAGPIGDSSFKPDWDLPHNHLCRIALDFLQVSINQPIDKTSAT